MIRNASKHAIAALALLLLIGISPVSAQTSAFTYQGKIEVSGTPANGAYDLQFKVFDALTNGVQQGPTLTLDDVPVTNGIFTVSLDFGAGVFPGAGRFLEVGIRAGAESGAFTTLAPRQQVASTPYAIKSLNAAAADSLSLSCVGCVTSNQIGSVAGGTVTSPIPVASVPAGSPSYIQNATALQSGSNFNISGTGKANVFDATTQYNIGGNRVLESAPNGTNVLVGAGAGNANAAGGFNTFVGRNAGYATTSGTQNSFLGNVAGRFNTSGSQNAFFGYSSGYSNATGNDNSFFGTNAGLSNVAGNDNSFFGSEAGRANTGNDNSFFGSDSGKANTSGIGNSFFGRNSGLGNTTGYYNSFYGSGSGKVTSDGVGNSFFGESSGLINSTGNFNSFFGKGAGLVNSTGSNNVFLGYSTGINNTVGSNNTLIGANAQVSSGGLQYATAIGAGATVTTSNTIVLGRSSQEDGVLIWGKTYATNGLSLGWFQPGGSTPLCYGGGTGGFIGFCSSSIRYKENVQDFTRGLDLITKLRPVTYNWKSNGQRDLGFIAEEVSEVEPLLSLLRPDGQIEGVKYAQITTALVNAVKEQQAVINQQQQRAEQQAAQIRLQQQQIEAQQRQFDRQQQEIDTLKRLARQSARVKTPRAAQWR